MADKNGRYALHSRSLLNPLDAYPKPGWLIKTRDQGTADSVLAVPRAIKLNGSKIFTLGRTSPCSRYGHEINLDGALLFDNAIGASEGENATELEFASKQFLQIRSRVHVASIHLLPMSSASQRKRNFTVSPQVNIIDEVAEWTPLSFALPRATYQELFIAFQLIRAY
jgi:hypothetical protein